MTEKQIAVRLGVGQIAAIRLKREGDALSNAYKDFLNRLVRQQRVIDKLKRDCGVDQ